MRLKLHIGPEASHKYVIPLTEDGEHFLDRSTVVIALASAQEYRIRSGAKSYWNKHKQYFLCAVFLLLVLPTNSLHQFEILYIVISASSTLIGMVGILLFEPVTSFIIVCHCRFSSDNPTLFCITCSFKQICK